MKKLIILLIIIIAIISGFTNNYRVSSPNAVQIRTYRSQRYQFSPYDAEDILPFLGKKVVIEFRDNGIENTIVIIAGAIRVDRRDVNRLLLIGKTESRTTFLIPIDSIDNIEKI